MEFAHLTYGLCSMRRYVIAKKVGKEMQRIRNQKKLNQESVAERSGMHVATYGRIERGESNAPLQTLNKIAKALKIPISDLLK